MKYLLIIISVLFSLDAFSQGQWNNQTVNNKINRVKIDSVAIVPRDTASTNNALDPKTGAPVGDSGRIAYQGQKFWGHYGSLGWQQIGIGDSSVGGAVDTAHTVEDLMGYSAALNTVVVSEKYRGGVFTYIPAPTTPPIDSGIVFPATGKGGGVWYRNWDNSAVNAAWFGCLPGTSDASRGLNKAIETFAPLGIGIYLPAGTYRLRDILVKRGTKITANQITKSNILDNVPVKILPVMGTTTNVFKFESTAVFSALEHLFIDADYVNSPNLAAAVRMDGYSNLINDVTIINAADCALSASAPLGGQYGLNSRLEHSSIHGMVAPFQPFTGFNDFHGATQITGGDITITDVEFGANLPYLSINIPPDPADMLRDPVNSRIVAFCADVLVNAWVYNNFFENGDQGCVIKQGEHNTFYGNRYEMNGTRGLLLKIVQHSTFTTEKFGNNSLAINGAGEDVRLDTGGVAYCDFTNLNFKKFVDMVNIPTSYYKVKFNIVNYSGPGGNSMTSPTFSDTTSIIRYDSLGHFDNTIQSVPFRHIEGQTNYKAPTFDGLTVGGNGFTDPWTPITSKGGLELQSGTTAGTGGFSGSLRFYNQAGTTTGSVGFDAFPGLTFSSTGNATFLTGGLIHAKAGGTVLNMISDNTGNSDLQFSSDVVPTRSALMRFYNANGDFTMSASRHMYLGLINNLELNINGQNYLRNTPDYAIGDTTFSFLVRKKDGGQIQIKAKEYVDSIIDTHLLTVDSIYPDNVIPIFDKKLNTSSSGLFTATGSATYNFSPTGLTISNGNTGYTSFISIPNNSSAEDYTFQLGPFVNSINGTGIGIGIESYTATEFAIAHIDLSAAGTRGKLYITQTKSSDIISSGSNLSFTNSSDSIILTLKRTKLGVTAIATNLSTRQSVTCSYNYTTVALVPGMGASVNRVGRPSIYALGGTQIFGNNSLLRYEINAQLRPKVAVIGDSNGYGYGSSMLTKRWANLLGKNGFSSINLVASSSTIADGLKIKEELKAISPEFAIFSLGTNDVLGGVTSDIIKYNIDSLNRYCQVNNIIPIWLAIPPVSSPYTAANNDTINLINTYLSGLGIKYININTPLKSGGVLATAFGIGDGVHLSSMGHNAVAQTIVDSTREIFYYKDYTIPILTVSDNNEATSNPVSLNIQETTSGQGPQARFTLNGKLNADGSFSRTKTTYGQALTTFNVGSNNLDNFISNYITSPAGVLKTVISSQLQASGSVVTTINDRVLINNAIDDGTSALQVAGNTLFSGNGSPGPGKRPTGTDALGNWIWRDTAASGITSLNTLTGGTQTFATGTTGTDFNISSASTTHTFNIPSMAVSGATRGLLTNTTQVLPGDKSLTGVTTLASGWATGSFAFGATTAPSTARVNILSANTSGLYIINSTTLSASTGGFARLMNSGTASAADQRMGGVIFGTNPSTNNFRSMGSIEMLSEAAHTDNVSQPSYMRFLTTPVSTASAVERMRITAGGDLGLGTTAPTSPAAFRVFHINDGTSGSSPGIHLTNDATGGAVGDGTMMWVGNAGAAGNTSFNIYNQENSPIALFTSSTERMRLLGNGNLLIGTTTDGGQKLQVNGNANVSGITQTVGLGVSGPASFNGGVTINNQTLTGSGSLSVGGPLVIYVNNTGTATITLPTAASASGYIQYIKKVSAATNNVVINVTSSGTIDGGASVTMLTQNSCVGLQSNGTEWKIISAYVGGAAL